MGRVKEVLAELDNGAEVVITQWGLTFGEKDMQGSYHMTVNDIEQTKQVLDYLRQIRPFETLKDITGSHPHIPFPDQETAPVTPAIAASPSIGKRVAK